MRRKFIHLICMLAGVDAIPLNFESFLQSLTSSLLPISTLSSLFDLDSAADVECYSRTRSSSLVSREEYESWINTQSSFAFESIIQNIGGYGPNLEDALPGLVIASPSKYRPDYYYQWTRDAAISINVLISQYNYVLGANETLRKIIDSYISSSAKIQRVSNPSGDFASLDGLGEPKFNVDGSAFTGSWGRPQRDGPALRANAMINYINAQLRFNSTKTISEFDTLYDQIIKPDLDYVASRWQQQGFDIWEEVNGIHFFTAMVQLRSMVSGAELANVLGNKDAENVYNSQARAIYKFIHETFYDSSKGHLLETVNYAQRSGLDAAIFIGSIYGLDFNWKDTNDTAYPPYSDQVIQTLGAMVSDMKERFPINTRRILQFKAMGWNGDTVGVGIGRYPEDVYNGAGTSLGNPWFICTASVAQTLYIFADYLASQPNDSKLRFPDPVKKFYSTFMDYLVDDWNKPGFELSRTNCLYDVLVKDIIAYGDSFLDVIREHQAKDGSMDEQFSRYDGWMTGAKNLTWSYGAFWSAARQRNLTLTTLNVSSI